MHETDASSILVPAPTPWPFIAALGITLMFSGIVTHIAVTMVGTAILLRAAIGWWFDVLPEQKEEAVSVSVADLAAACVPKSSSRVDRLTNGVERHRVRIPVEVHPYWTGVYGGLVGAVAMAVVATLFGLIAQGSIWYPINLLAAGILPTLDHASIAQLRQFSEAGLIAGSFIHLTTSVLVGMLYAVSLPMFPKGATWRSGLLTPVLWSGLIAATLSLVNPTLNERINWGWFVGSQIAFGLACSWVIARTAKIETMQSWPLTARAGIEAQMDSEEKTDL
ncbi:MAG TPA: hypothetical protein VLW06_06935 [Terriglobales bacterium]|nr:hypothetical protein [Terriglobales bacterium]